MTDEQNNQTSVPETIVNEWEAKAQEYLDNWKRSEANLVNYKKDEERRVKDILQFGNESILMQAIFVMDNIERALLNVPPEVLEKQSAWLQGIQQTVKQFQELLAKYKVERIKSVGEKFDPLYHEAIVVDSGEGLVDSEQRILEEYQSGYVLNGKVIRPAQVKISK